MDEIWKPVPGFGGHYEASSLGRVRSKARTVKKWHKSGKFIEQSYDAKIIGSKNPEGYYTAHISVDGIRSNAAIHRMVASAFHGTPRPGQECCHNNGDPGDNRPENLRWDSHLENNRDRLRHGTYKRGREHHQAKFPEAFLERVASGQIEQREAVRLGISKTHYNRVRNRGTLYAEPRNG
jgi:hypothetical protein